MKVFWFSLILLIQ